MTRLCISLFGAPRFELDGKIIRFPTSKSIALTAYLAITRKICSRKEVAQLLWSDESEAHALASLRTEIWRLKQLIPNDIFLAYRDQIGLKVDENCWIDVFDFEDLVESSLEHDHPKYVVCQSCLEKLTKAASLYSGAFLAEIILNESSLYEDWLTEVQSKLGTLADLTMNWLIDSYARLGDLTQSLAYAIRRMELTPNNEPLIRQTMSLYATTGQPKEAIKLYYRFTYQLKREFKDPPQDRTRALFNSIRKGELPDLVLQDIDQLPEGLIQITQPPTPFVGRDEEIEKIILLLSNPECHLITLLGPGGIGKTRIAIQAALKVASRSNIRTYPLKGQLVNRILFPDGIFFVPLNLLDDAEKLPSAICSSLQMYFHGKPMPMNQLLAYLHEKRLLLILDGFEHTIKGSNLLLEIIETAPWTKIIVTSQESLHIKEGTILNIEGLPYPRDGQWGAVDSFSAVQLFLQSARRAKPDYTPQAKEWPFLVRICQVVDGLPLGIELAASWIQTRSCAEIADEIQRNVEFLASPSDNFPIRHRNLHAVFEYSWSRLTPQEKEVLLKCCIFQGGFSKDAAIEIARLSQSSLTSLEDKCFLRKLPTGRYEILEVMRLFIEEKLKADPYKLERAFQLHVNYFSKFLHRIWEELSGSRQLELYKKIQDELPNFRVALKWSTKHSMVSSIRDFLPGIMRLYIIQGWYEEGITICHEITIALKIESLSYQEIGEEKTRLLGNALCFHAQFLNYLGRSVESLEKAYQALEIARFLGDDLLVGDAFLSMGLTYYLTGESEKSRHCLEQSQVCFHKAANQKGEAYALMYYGFVAGSQSRSRDYFERSLSLMRETGELWGVALSTINLSDSYLNLEDFKKARELALEAMKICRAFGNPPATASALTNIGEASLMLGDYREARRCFLESLERVMATGIPVLIANAQVNMGFVSVKMGKFRQAGQYFSASLRALYDHDNKEGVLEALTGVAFLWNEQKKFEPAFELAFFINKEPSLSNKTRHHIQWICRQSVQKFSPEDLSRIEAKVPMQFDDEMVDTVLSTLA